MTIEELYKIAKEQHIENYDIEIQYRDGGGIYSGTDFLDSEDIKVNDTTRTVIL